MFIMIMNMTEKTTYSALKAKIEWNETMDMLYFICGVWARNRMEATLPACIRWCSESSVDTKNVVAVVMINWTDELQDHFWASGSVVLCLNEHMC